MMANNKFNPSNNDFNQQPQDNDNKRTLYLIIGSVVALLVILFICYRIFFSAKDQTSKNTSSNSDSRISHIKKSGKDTQDEDADTALNGNSGSKGSNNAGVGLDFNKNLSDDDNGMKLTGVTYAGIDGTIDIIPRQSNIIATSTDQSFSLTSQPDSQSWGKLIYSGELYGFAAYRTGSTWKRIDTIKPIPNTDADMKDYGGKSADLISSDIKNTSILKDKGYKNGSIDNLDISKHPELETMNKDTDTKKGINTISELLIEQAPKLVQTGHFYFQDEYKYIVTQKGYLSVPASQRFRFGDTYMVIPSKKAVQTLNTEAQKNASNLVDSWTTKVSHTIYVNGKLIIIDGVAYNLKDIALDLYDKEDTTGMTSDAFKDSNINVSSYNNPIKLSTSNSTDSSTE